MSLLHRARFIDTVARLDHLARPGLDDGLPEVAFVGRSNAGKSTAINLLCNQKRLAFASKTPGRTQHLNFFEIADREQRHGLLVDLPGYGYAEAGHQRQAEWDQFLGRYLSERPELRGLILMMDARRPLTDLDIALLDFVRPRLLPVHVLLTKADKLTRNDQNQVLMRTRNAMPGHTVQLFSALKRMGIEEADAKVLSWFPPEDARPLRPPAPEY
ncbi:ribosome biogenesis GTP-binding protein YihA/YsxC [Derxia lacustris]|uniref:ribosome biogenesis GTP-binding protein YihA/YsxC n=1 Tax=Derxia lacustris TaxID=764842 RepID=UPI000A16E843|nr:ribosome biogenesis GTP-binding protein YihA/YsxC [Derxia lacustris]